MSSCGVIAICARIVSRRRANSCAETDDGPSSSGTVSFLFTDIEGSTALWERDRQAMSAAVERHFALLDEAVSAQNGVLFKTIGDATQAALPTVPNAMPPPSLPSWPCGGRIGVIWGHCE